MRKKLGGKWKPMIMQVLLRRDERFNKIKQLLPGISSNMLSKTLRELENDRIIYKVEGVYVTYVLTDTGRSIAVLLLEIKDLFDLL